MQLHISDLTQAEFGAYRCVAKNSLGDTDGTIKLYRKLINVISCAKICFDLKSLYYIKIIIHNLLYFAFRKGNIKRHFFFSA